MSEVLVTGYVALPRMARLTNEDVRLTAPPEPEVFVAEIYRNSTVDRGRG